MYLGTFYYCFLMLVGNNQAGGWVGGWEDRQTMYLGTVYYCSLTLIGNNHAGG